MSVLLTNNTVPPVGLAPMEGVSTLPMRLWFALTSAPKIMSTPFLRVTASYPMKQWPDGFCPELFPSALQGTVPYLLIPQLMAAEGADFVRTAEEFLSSFPFIDLNCGCPSPTCTGKGAGSSLLKDPATLATMLTRIIKALGPGRLSVKMRTGYADASELPALLEALESLPLAQLTIHGRTRTDAYKGTARWDLIATAAQRLPYPVIASGDVVDVNSFQSRLATAPGLAGVIVGRGALRNPWLFTELHSVTSEPTKLPYRCILLALASYVILHELAASKPVALYELCHKGFFLAPCGTSVEAWREAVATLYEALEGRSRKLDDDHTLSELSVSRASLSRGKLLWNYMRSALPSVCFAPEVMRANSVADLLGRMASLLPLSETVTLRHRPDLDWLYNGGKNDARRQTLPHETCRS